MATRKIVAEVTTKLVLVIEEGVEISEVMDEMDYEFTPQQEHGHTEDSEIIDYNILDSK